MNIPRPEHPKPQFERAGWLNLNGTWQFEIDNGKSGVERGLSAADATLSGEITVPFCPESDLSGVGHKDFMYGVWYQRRVTLTEEQISGRVFLHFGAVDYTCTAFVNGKQAGKHSGGYVSFSFDITELVVAGDNVITVYAEDDTRSTRIPSGKQCHEYASFGCHYTRTTGIWQTVWLEFAPETHIEKVKYYPNIEAGTLTVNATLCGRGTFTVKAAYEGAAMGEASVASAGGNVTLTLSLRETHLWEPGAGRLYDLELTYGEDTVRSYFGLRQVAIDGEKFLFNGRSLFMRTVLDQGFYPDGIYTAPSDEALQRDIRLSMACGFAGARLHEKIFEERFLYHCDKAGYYVWGESPNWGLDVNRPDAAYAMLPEWIEAVERDFNHPALIGWCPFNETWDDHDRTNYEALLRLTYQTTKAVDPTRPFLDTSGGFHVITDIYDVHDYEQDPAVYGNRYEPLKQGEAVRENMFPDKACYRKGTPFFISEMGGIAWAKSGGWGYGNAPETEEAFIERFTGLCRATMQNEHICGLCYTQLTDVEQEQNGMYEYDRSEKFDPAIFKSVLSEKAAIED